MNSEPNYKVLSTVTINGNKVELRENRTSWSVVTEYEFGTIDKVFRSYEDAAAIYEKIKVDGVLT